MKVSELSKAIADELTLLQESSTQAVKQAARETAADIRDDIKAVHHMASPVGTQTAGEPG